MQYYLKRGAFCIGYVSVILTEVNIAANWATFVLESLGRWENRGKVGCSSVPPHLVVSPSHLNSAGGASGTKSHPVAPADLDTCGLNQNYSLIDYLLGSRKAVMDLILNPPSSI